ncbi:sulfite exporter TauE/SafE family protein [Ruminiclostridium cellobioparum]|uniref:Probable membrane transporter protein n=1 Tax=Ruminiclostridium cellobioparum subsp. termitidis CT1112 TaxID=1195236 RepID=S0FN55_RUMCE|nr:sulfite exporter TauE/SafE family protein [Ruminiclostridium cellobioparum]EMS71791.1 putative permease [Ruminiclostridium cellobioparum subsp. termitidis CT1112]
MYQLFWLIPLGFMVGTFGTLIGAGGGFILVPVMLLLYPDKSPETITAISLAVVFFNSLSGSVAYARMKKIDYKSGIIFSIATLPGSILGSLATSLIPRNIFNLIFGVILLIGSVYLFIKPQSKNRDRKSAKGDVIRSVTDIDGVVHTFSYNPVLGIVISVLVGFLSSLLGIGGGIIHVPVMIQVLNFPVHLATATSHFVLASMSFSGSMVHLATGVLSSGLMQTAGLSIGVLFGAQLGARLSKRLKGGWIVRSLALALGIAGIRILIMVFI